MSRIVVCMDCPSYQKGGHCRHKHKDVAALAPACDYAIKMNQTFNPEEEDMTTPKTPFILEPMSMEEHEKLTHEPAEALPTPYPTKVCSCCGETKPLSEFYKDKKATDGLKAWCKRCVSLNNAERARKARAEKRANKQVLMETGKTAEQPKTTEKRPQPKRIVVRETLTDKEMVDILREHGWTVTCTRTITEAL